MMDPTDRWNQWLADADSVLALAPEGYDDDASMARVRALQESVLRGLPEYQVKFASPELYQDSTGLSHGRIASKSSDATLGWIGLSHFGELVTVEGCSDAELLVKIRRLLEGLGLKYIDYDYLANRTYHGKCKSLTGLSWANRYFALAVDFNDAASPLDSTSGMES